MKDGSRLKIFIIVFFSAMGGMLYGYDIGIINGAFLFIANDIPMTVTQTSFLGGSVLFGGAFAILIGGVLADLIGRKKTISLAGLIFLISVLMIYVSDTYTELLISRLVQGVAVGFISITVPLYLTEAVPSSIRGVAVTSFQLLLTAGILLANYVGLFFEASGNWRAMFLTALVPGVIVFAGSFMLIKSPRWLIMNNRESEAEDLLIKTLGYEKAKEQMLEVKTLIDSTKNEGSIWKNLHHRHYLVPMMLVFSIAILAQLTGINSILQYASTMLKEAGLGSNYASLIGGVTITAINFVTTIAAVLMADKVERKFVIGFGTFMVSVSLVATGIMLALLPVSELKGWLLLAGFVSFIFFFAIGPGAYVWVIMSELLPTSIRSKGLAVALFLNSMASAILASVFLPMSQSLGQSSIFYVCGACTLLYSFIVFKFVPKTNGLSLEEIERGFVKK